MHRAHFACQRCYRDDQTLNVHHLYYMSKRDPWDYPNFALQCICEECHAEDHESNISSFESRIIWMVGNDFENIYFNEIADQIREVRYNQIIDPNQFLEDCMKSITKIRKKSEKQAMKQNENKND